MADGTDPSDPDDADAVDDVDVARTGPRRPSMIRRAARISLALVGVVVVYYAFPVGDLPSGSDLAVAVVGLVVGLVALVYVGVRQLRVLARTPAGDPDVRLDVLLLVVLVVVPLFALGYFAVEQADPDQFADLETKTDALYLALSTLATVGFGDVHATGQLARSLVNVQMLFDLVFVAALVSVLGGEVRARAAERRDGSQAGAG